MELNTSGASNCSSENKYFLYSSIDRTLDTHAAFGTEHKRVKASLKPERRRGRDGEVGAEAGGAEGGGHGDDDVDVFLYCQHIVLLSGDATLMHVGCMCSQQYSFVAGSAWFICFTTSLIHGAQTSTWLRPISTWLRATPTTPSLPPCVFPPLCSLIVWRRNSIYRCTPENLQSRWRRERERGRWSVRLTERPNDRASDRAID